MEFGDALWRKSSYSSETADCVEVALSGAWVGIRDSKKPEDRHLTVPASALRALVSSC
jgi:hypothetical protein